MLIRFIHKLVPKGIDLLIDGHAFFAALDVALLNQKRISLEEEYADKVKSINDKLASDIQAANDKYQSALDSRESSLYSSYGLFDEVKEK